MLQTAHKLKACTDLASIQTSYTSQKLQAIKFIIQSWESGSSSNCIIKV